MDSLLTQYNQKKRNGKKIISTDYIIRKRGDLLHICLNSPGCRYRNSGSCTMCDYGEGSLLTEKKVEALLPKIQDAAVGMNSILIGSLGSVLDMAEVSRKCLSKICRFLNESSLETIIFETHYTLVNDEVCQWLKKQMPLKDIVIEIGLESADEFVQEKCLNKKIDLEVLESKIDMLHSYDMSITANAFLGAPFLSVTEQIEDTEKTIQWAVDHGVDSVVLFPANIRKNTILEELYRNGKYSRMQHWAVFEVLWRIPWHYLNRIYLAWYGDWIDVGADGVNDNLPPYCCDMCSNKWMEFYRRFLEESDNRARRHLLVEYGNELKSKCNCRDLFEQTLKTTTLKERSQRVEKMKKWLACQHGLTTDK